MSNEIDIYSKGQLSAKDVQGQIMLIQQVMASVMKEEVHYGKIPGCGDKPALFKPGAEKILATFRLAADPIIEDLSSDDEIRYRIKTEIRSSSDIVIGYGVGECSSNEDKYKWRGSVCDGEFEETEFDRKREKWKKGWNNAPDTKIKQVRTNIADIANTILKMAKKRSLVDACLTTTACSDIFEQDIEDLGGVIDMDRPGSKPAVQKTQRKSSQKKTTTDPEATEDECFIKVERVGKKDNKDPKKNPKYIIHSVGGTMYNTFDKDIADSAKEIEGTDIEILVQFTTGKWGNTIKENGFVVTTPVENDSTNPEEQ